MADWLRLIFLAAIWGGSFLFMQIAAPVLGSGWLVFGRVGIGALFLYAVVRYLNKEVGLRLHWKHYAMMAFFNSALPFFLYAEATLSLNTSQLSVLNATAPAWAYLIGVIIKNEAFNVTKILGLLIGFAGVFIILDKGNFDFDIDYRGAAMALMATFCYGVATNYAKSMKQIDPYANAFGSMVFSSLMILPALPFFPIKAELTLPVLVSMLALGILCSGVAYMLYFRVVNTMGATSALTVSYLIPMFGTLWGILILDEAVTSNGILGAVVVLVGTYIVTRTASKTT
jgi:drug/metabolite transporter (DMT)-like permease